MSDNNITVEYKALAFYKTGKTHLRDSKILFEAESYSNSIFLLQQSVEMVAKAYGLMTGVIQIEDVKKIGHKPHKIATNELMKNKETFGYAESNLPNIMSVFPDEIAEGMREYSNVIANFSKRKFEKLDEEFYLLDNNYVDDLVEGFQDLLKIPSILQKVNYEEEVTPLIKETLENIVSEIESHTGSKPEEFADLLKEENLNLLIKISGVIVQTLMAKMIYMGQGIMQLSLITSSHNQPTRYPCPCCYEIPDNTYNADDVIVNRYPDLITIYENTLSIFDDFFINRSAFAELDKELQLIL